ncbi:hypothetical protein EAS64_25095 [Trebonia kvetii]|uniref:Uncharacterized protein n=1 Tax=Trebonia kvetii TaxID=2480626 RepID=A0A6P2BT98_9ACTN|nr:hypothetical protein [Trebonia kvetii]TVZ02118.1 hypothetical protein EAS64_25095 [Trebonia kvetii]
MGPENHVPVHPEESALATLRYYQAEHGLEIAVCREGWKVADPERELVTVATYTDLVGHLARVYGWQR